MSRHPVEFTEGSVLQTSTLFEFDVHLNNKKEEQKKKKKKRFHVHLMCHKCSITTVAWEERKTNGLIYTDQPQY